MAIMLPWSVMAIPRIPSFIAFVNQARHAGLTVEDGILGVHMKMYEVLHIVTIW